MTRLDKLWRAVEGPGAPPRLDSGRVKARVNAVLGAGPAERRIDMRKRFCFILAAAAALAIMGTAFAAAVDWNALSAHFQGGHLPGPGVFGQRGPVGARSKLCLCSGGLSGR